MFDNVNPVHAAAVIVGVGTIIFVTIYFLKNGPITELLFINLHEFKKGDYVSLEQIKAVIPVVGFGKLEDGLEMLIAKGRVQTIKLGDVVKFRVHPDHWIEQRVPTQQFN